MKLGIWKKAHLASLLPSCPLASTREPMFFLGSKISVIIIIHLQYNIIDKVIVFIIFLLLFLKAHVSMHLYFVNPSLEEMWQPQQLPHFQTVVGWLSPSEFLCRADSYSRCGLSPFLGWWESGCLSVWFGEQGITNLLVISPLFQVLLSSIWFKGMETTRSDRWSEMELPEHVAWVLAGHRLGISPIVLRAQVSPSLPPQLCSWGAAGTERSELSSPTKWVYSLWKWLCTVWNWAYPALRGRQCC